VYRSPIKKLNRANDLSPNSSKEELKKRLVTPPDPISLVDIDPQAEDYNNDFENVR